MHGNIVVFNLYILHILNLSVIFYRFKKEKKSYKKNSPSQFSRKFIKLSTNLDFNSK